METGEEPLRDEVIETFEGAASLKEEAQDTEAWGTPRLEEAALEWASLK